VSATLAEQLRPHLRDALGAAVDVRDLRRITGGASHETWAVDATDGGDVHEELVVRRDIERGILDSDGDVEFRLLAAIHDAGVPVPRPWLRAEPRDGVPGLTVLQRVAGADARKVLARGDGPDPAALRRGAAAVQARIHRVDWRTTLRGVLPTPSDSPARTEVEEWAAAVDAAESGPQPLLQAAISWLLAHPPRPVEPVLVHGDFKANNLLVAPDGALTVLDWELTHVGDPLEDIAWTLLWDTPADLAPAGDGRDAYVDAYGAEAGTPVDREALAFWELFSLVKLAAIFLTGVRPGAANLPSLLMLGRAVPHLDARIASHLLAELRKGNA
jgi:aminoglycoside phosphotransferase (APT) family kinase protein